MVDLFFHIGMTTGRMRSHTNEATYARTDNHEVSWPRFRISAGPVVDFTQGFAAGMWNPLWEDFYCDWRTIWFNDRTEPPSWVLGDAVIAAGAKGILFRSRLSPSGTNLVRYVDELATSDNLEVHDPSGSLPHNQSSWK